METQRCRPEVEAERRRGGFGARSKNTRVIRFDHPRYPLRIILCHGHFGGRVEEVPGQDVGWFGTLNFTGLGRVMAHAGTRAVPVLGVKIPPCNGEGLVWAWLQGLEADDKLDDSHFAAAIEMSKVGTKYTKDDVRFPNTSMGQSCWYVDVANLFGPGLRAVVCCVSSRVWCWR
jgi:hypothetical protein